MKGGAQTALAIGVGYVLGRRRKMRVATALALGAATGGLGKLGPLALKRAGKYLGSTDIGGALGPQVGEIASTIRSDLLGAGKAAATAAVSGRIESLSDTLHDRAETLRNPEAAAAASESVGRAGQSLSRRGRRGRPAEETDEERGNGRSRRPAQSETREPEDEYEDDEAYDDELDEPEDELDEPEDEAEDFDGEEPEDEEAAPRRTRTSRSPVARTRR